MPSRWSTQISIGWHPILTFERRRLELLDWVEDNVHYTGFTDQPDVVGLEVGPSAARAQFRRQGLDISLNGPEREVSSLDDLLEGALTILAPKHPKILVVRSAWSHALEGSYEELCRRFASQVAIGLVADEFWATDASALVDFVTPQAQLQCEYGVVTKEELAARLENPSLSRLRTKMQGASLFGTDDLPDLAMYGGISWIPFDVVRIGQPADIEAAAIRALDESARLVTGLASRFVHEFGGAE